MGKLAKLIKILSIGGGRGDKVGSEVSPNILCFTFLTLKLGKYFA